ncbi:hypothetical protein SAMN05444336_10254 [Albimonas donghaensis]|uniref:Uncharacterized protein n=1 Tax=Albimonas donghaensis TaxID=356660 RepID=A0A1H2VGR9_9RHOB|nr:hypothetical protein [Albimonas donghaensis]MAS41865.1 hypothetical protein [Paracoccaceae bacterium]SDW67114.1 hypothetical protein SAMN05444336_10254 [Albimonas donghaensis]|tara:strand:- start:840 stop:1055 length:216 start_codon:yes stop_codon:yes gene_type:complete
MLNLIYRVPLIGWMIRDAMEGEEDAPVWFAVNLLMLWVLAGVIFGIQGVAMLALIATPIVFGLILTVTLGR